MKEFLIMSVIFLVLLMAVKTTIYYLTPNADKDITMGTIIGATVGTGVVVLGDKK